jgi:pimeloyl-ACP methyl ester carboxylesterase
MHGWGGSGSGSFWAPVMRHLDSRNVRIVLLDLRGHGRSEHTREGFITERFAKDMFEVADQIGAGELIPVGYSMSGRWAQWMACACPERIVGQVLVGPAPASAMPLTPELIDYWLQSIATRDGYHRFENQFTKNTLPEDVLDDGLQQFGAHRSFRCGRRYECARSRALRRSCRLSSCRENTRARFACLDCGHNIPLEILRSQRIESRLAFEPQRDRWRALFMGLRQPGKCFVVTLQAAANQGERVRRNVLRLGAALKVGQHMFGLCSLTGLSKRMRV